MAESIGNYQVSAFTSPTNNTTADADIVRGNDNSVRAAFNSHDSDPGIHLQSSLLADRPVAGVSGRKWLTSDDRRIYFDDGSNWQELAYAKTASPVFSGTIIGVNLTLSGNIVAVAATLSGALTVAGVSTFNGSIGGAPTFSGAVTFSAANPTKPITLSGASAKIVFSGTGSPGIDITSNVAFTISGQLNSVNLASTTNINLQINSGFPLISLSAATGGIAMSCGAGTGGILIDGTPSTSGNVTIQAATGQKILLTTSGATWEIRTDGKLYVGGNRMLTLTPSPAYTAPTGTTSRGTFDQSTVTLAQLAQRVASLILDLQVHGLIG